LAYLKLKKGDKRMNALDKTVKELYQCICFKKGQKPKLKKLKALFFEEGKLVNNNGETPQAFTSEKYITVFQEKIFQTKVTEFSEKEVFSKTEIFGKIAQRFSTYETRYVVAGSKYFSQGINSIQLLKINGKWLVTSLIWNNQSKTLKIPKRYLTKR
jgi:hypothetical protein